MSTESRKLSTILFADITGYTALMQTDETKAMEWLNTFKHRLNDIVPNFSGQIVQYFGDACLLSFDSTSQGVRCAMALQNEFQTAKLPIRIGMHLGEVVFTESNVFGDGVNIASRIESMGVPGGILVSKTVRDQIKNKSEFQLTSLGDFEFKNIKEPLEVFAVANPGFVVPRREEMKGKLKAPVAKSRSKWIVPSLIIGAILIAGGSWILGKETSSPLSKETRERPVAVLPFENQTMQSYLDAFGLMAQDWISRGLLEAGGATVIRETDENIFNSDLQKISAPAGAEVIIQGRYYKKGDDQMVVTAEVVDAVSNEILHTLTPLTAMVDDPMPTLVDIQQKLIGYWNLGATYPGKPPRYDAYEAYTSALYLKEDYPYTKKIEYYEKALAMDSSFTEPLFALFNLSRWGFVTELKESSLNSLRAKKASFSPFQKLQWESYDALSTGDLKKAAEAEWKIYEQFNLDHHATSSITFSRFANELNAVVEKASKFIPIVPDTTNGYVLGRLTSALFDLGRYDEIIENIDAFPGKPQFLDGVLSHVRALAMTDRIDELDEMLEFYKEHSVNYGGYYNYGMLLTGLINPLYKNDRTDLIPNYIKKAEEWFDYGEAQYLFRHTNKAHIHFIKEEYEAMYNEGVKLWDNYKVNFTGEQAGVALFKLGRFAELEAYIEDLKSRGDTFPGSTAYALAVIEAQRNPELAMKYLKEAETEGYEWDWYSHRNDALLKVLEDYPPFIEFTEPK